MTEMSAEELKLRKQSDVIRKKVQAIADRREAREARKHVGKFYRSRNNYSLPEKPSDYWWHYIAVLSYRKRSFQTLAFQTDKYGTISIERREHYGNTLFDKEITKAEFTQALNELKKRVTDLKAL